MHVTQFSAPWMQYSCPGRTQRRPVPTSRPTPTVPAGQKGEQMPRKRKWKLVHRSQPPSAPHTRQLLTLARQRYTGVVMTVVVVEGVEVVSGVVVVVGVVVVGVVVVASAVVVVEDELLPPMTVVWAGGVSTALRGKATPLSARMAPLASTTATPSRTTWPLTRCTSRRGPESVCSMSPSWRLSRSTMPGTTW